MMSLLSWFCIKYPFPDYEYTISHCLCANIPGGNPICERSLSSIHSPCPPRRDARSRPPPVRDVFQSSLKHAHDRPLPFPPVCTSSSCMYKKKPQSYEMKIYSA